MVWNSQNKVTSYLSCPNAFIKHPHLKGISKALLVKFEAVEYIIKKFLLVKDNTVTIYNYIRLYTKTSRNIYNHEKNCYQNCLPQPTETEQFNQPNYCSSK